MHDTGITPALLVFLCCVLFVPLRLILYTFVVIPYALADTSVDGDSMYKLVIISQMENASSLDSYTIISNGMRQVNLNALDEYQDFVTPCEDFYSKVCSLYDPLTATNDGGGTFRTMMHGNAQIIKDIIVQSYPQYEQCKSMLYSDITSTTSIFWDKVDNYTKKEQIATLFDLHTHGGLVPFVVNPNSKVLTGPNYCTEVDVNFEFYYFLMYSLQELYDSYSIQDLEVIDTIDNSKHDFRELMIELFKKLNMTTYPTSLRDYTSKYVRVQDITYKPLHRGLVDVFGLESLDYVMLNGQDPFFAHILEHFQTKILPSPVLQQLLAHQYLINGYPAPPAQRNRVVETPLSEKSGAFHRPHKPSYNARPPSRFSPSEDEVYMAVHNRNMLWSRLNKNHKIAKHTKIATLTDDSSLLVDHIEAFCLKQIREVFMIDVNSKYYAQINIKAQADYIEILVNDIINASSNFFGQVGRTDASPDINAEYVLHIGKQTATKARLKMDNIVINSMASVAKIEGLLMEWSKAERTALFYEEFPQCWFKSKTLDPPATRSGDFLEDRKNVTLAQMILWTTVKAETVNAWYDPTANSITIPVGIARHPLFRGDYTYDVSFLGSVIGHELGHATDSSGNQFDQIGSYTHAPWWDKRDVAYLHNMTRCIVEDYGSPCGSSVYGDHTLGEDMADQFGIRMVLSLSKSLLVETAINTSQVTPQEVQRLLNDINKDIFINFARVWCGRSTFAQECDNVAHDVHALAKDRVTKTLRQIKSFTDAFGCNVGDPMVNEARCIVY